MDITPHVNLLKSLRGERVDHVLLIGEGVDNALDAAARTVSVTFDREAGVGFSDDGHGVRRENIHTLFSLGSHGHQSTTALGRFGVGITSQAVNAGDVFEVVSTSVDGRFKAVANWRRILKSGVWHVEDPRWLPNQVGAKTGTIVRIMEPRKSSRYASIEKIIEELALCFHPALQDGRKIIFNGSEILPNPEPKLTDIIDRKLVLSDDRIAHVRAGILAEPSSLTMVHIGFKHRVIMPGVRLGCGSYGGVSKMFARVQLFGQWHLAKFKNDLTDEYEREELDDALAEALQPILQKCSSASITARIHNITSKINDLVPPEMRPARPKRKKRDPDQIKDGPKQDKKNRSGNVDKDKSDESETGPAHSKRHPKDQLIINLDGSDAIHGVGKFIPGRPHCVSLSPDNPYVASLIAMRDENLAASTLVTLGLSIYLHERGGDAPELPFEDFGKQLAFLISAQTAKISDLKTA